MDLKGTKQILEDFSVLPRHSLGQNFLVSEKISREIIAFNALQKEDSVLEIGPGLGALTEIILEQTQHLTVYEIDRRMVEILHSRLAEQVTLRIVEADILQVDLAATYPDRPPLKVIANLPYYITSPIIEKLICELPFCQSICLMMQKEAAARLLLSGDDSRYGVTAILLALYGDVRQKKTVAAANFYPRPNVASQVLCWQRKAENCFMQYQKINPSFHVSQFKLFLDKAFSMRRKTLYNNLKQNDLQYSEEQISAHLKSEGISRETRPEQLKPKQFWQLFLSMAK